MRERPRLLLRCFLSGRRLGYRLPRYGTTLRVIDEAYQPVDELVWNGRRFSMRRGPARPVVPPITPAEVTVKRFDERRDYPSPDGRYVARLRHDEGDVWNLTVTAAHSRRPLATTDDVWDLIWVPGRGHRLVAAACAIYGKARLGLWEGGTHWRSLYPIRRPDFECFTLYGVTPDGRSLAYGHDPDLRVTRPGRPNPLERRHWLRLPR